MCEALAAGTQHPLIMPLSRVSPSGQLEACEVAAADALAWTQGRALFADKLTSGEVALPGGHSRLLRAVDTTFIFPGEAATGQLRLASALQLGCLREPCPKWPSLGAVQPSLAALQRSPAEACGASCEGRSARWCRRQLLLCMQSPARTPHPRMHPARRTRSYLQGLRWA